MSPVYLNSQKLDSEKGESLFDFADSLSVRVPTSCGRTGECHECIVEIRKGAEAITPQTTSEKFLRGDYRLACQAFVADQSAGAGGVLKCDISAGNSWRCCYHL